MDPLEDEVIRTFSYAEQEQEALPYLRRYMERIRPKLTEIMQDPAKRERFMLAGLFLNYRAANHLGVEMTTDIEGGQTMDSRLSEFYRLTGRRIADSRAYLKMIRFSPFKLLLMGAGRFLYNFVMRG